MNSHLSTIRRFAAASHRKRLTALLAGKLLRTGMVFLAVSAVLHLFFILFPYTFFILLWDASVIVAFFLTVGTCCTTLFVRKPSLLSTARRLETTAATRLPHPLVSLALELSKSTDVQENDLYEEVYRRAAKQTVTLGAVPRQRPRPLKTARIIVLAVLCIIIPGTVRPRLWSYWQLPFGALRHHQLTVMPGTVHLPRNSSVSLRLHPAAGTTAPSCRVEITEFEKNGGSHLRRLYPDSLGNFSTRCDRITTSFTYTFFYGTIRCETETVTVVPPPLINSLRITLTPPLYTGLPSRTLPEGQGDFTVYRGTRAAVEIHSSPLLSASLLCGNDTLDLEVNGSAARCTLSVTADNAYTFALTDTFLQKNDTLASYTIGIVPDELPAVRFLRPGINKPLEPAQQETLLVEATDDLGIRTLELHYCKSGECGKPESRDLSPAFPAPLVQRQFTWKLSRLSLYPGDTVFYWARSRDTRSPGKPQFAFSDTFFFRIPTFDEIHRAMNRRESDVKERLSAARRRQDELSQKAEELDKAIAGSEKQAGWEEQQLAEKIESIMREQADSLQTSLEQLEENVKQLRNEGTLGEDIARKMDEIKKTMEELIRQYGDSLLFNRNEKGEITMNDLRQAVDKLNEMLPELSERLDNTLQFLEALKRDRELAELALRAEKLAGEQAQLSERDPADPQSAPRQEDLLDRINRLKEDIRSASSENGNDLENDPTMQQMDSLSAAMENRLAQDQMPSPGTMRQMSGSLASMAQQLHEKTNAFRQEQLEALRKRLLDLAGETIDMSEWQRQLSLASESTSDENALRARVREQQALHEVLDQIGRSMDSLPLLAPSLRQKLRSSLSATQKAAGIAVESMNSSDGSFGMQITGQAINRLTGELLDIAAALGGNNQGSCNSPGGMQESLRKMSGRQAAVNSATARLLRALMQGRQPGQGTEEGGNGEGNEAARKEAQDAQRKIADELKELGEKFGDATGEGMRERIKQLEEEARGLTRMLNEPREEVTERQDRFLARMLQSALSLHREEEGKEERQSKSSGIVFTPTAGTLTDSAVGTVDAFQRLRRKALNSGTYPLSYRKSINSYFDSLGVLYLRETGGVPIQE
ncbi:MAG: hypothetical protein JW863_14490 [Chitinispirillaceae bacterium]|nr:hypothetical protein [Chitinispirillaceae bacterium]